MHQKMIDLAKNVIQISQLKPYRGMWAQYEREKQDTWIYVTSKSTKE